MRRLKCVLGGLCLSVFASCSPVIETQNIPVSSNPMGANVYADGNYTCQTPCKVILAKNSEHIITIKKNGFKQIDVIVKRQYQQEKVLMNAVSSGLGTSDTAYGGSTAWGIVNGLSSIDSQESTGAAYVLTPSAISASLVAEGASTKDAVKSDKNLMLETATPAQMNSGAIIKDAVKATAVGITPKIHGGVTAKDSSTHEGYSSDGSFTTSTTKTTVKAGVNVNPAEALEELGNLVIEESK